MNKFLEEMVRNEKQVISCPTYESACMVVNLFRENVHEEEKMNRSFYDSNGSETCLNIYEDRWIYDNKDWYQRHGYAIMEFKDFIEKAEEEEGDGSELIAIVGCSASGKDTIQEDLVKQDVITPVVSHTSRPTRVNEVDGVTYHYITYEKALWMLENDEFIEDREYETITPEGNKAIWIYGIAKSTIDKIDFVKGKDTYIVIVDFEGLKALEEYMESKGVRDKLCSIFIRASSQARLTRSLNREGNMTEGQVSEVIRRYLDDKEKVEPAMFHCDIVLSNEKKNDLARCTKVINGFIRKKIV